MTKEQRAEHTMRRIAANLPKDKDCYNWTILRTLYNSNNGFAKVNGKGLIDAVNRYRDAHPTTINQLSEISTDDLVTEIKKRGLKVIRVVMTEVEL